MDLAEATVALRVYEGGVPAHAQVFVDPECRVCDYLDGDGNVLSTIVHDAVSINSIAERLDADIVIETLGDIPKSPTKVAAENNGAEAEQLAPPTVDATAAGDAFMATFDPSKHNVDEVVEYLRSVEDNEDEWTRVIAAEKDGKARATVLDEQE